MRNVSPWPGIVESVASRSPPPGALEDREEPPRGSVEVEAVPGLVAVRGVSISPGSRGCGRAVGLGFMGALQLGRVPRRRGRVGGRGTGHSRERAAASGRPRRRGPLLQVRMSWTASLPRISTASRRCGGVVGHGGGVAAGFGFHLSAGPRPPPGRALPVKDGHGLEGGVSLREDFVQVEAEGPTPPLFPVQQDTWAPPIA